MFTEKELRFFITASNSIYFPFLCNVNKFIVEYWNSSCDTVKTGNYILFAA